MTTTQADRELDARVAREVFGVLDGMAPPGWRWWFTDEDGCNHPRVPQFFEDPAADLSVLEHVRDTWDHAARWRFAAALLDLWRARGGRGPLPLRYIVGDYARAALAVKEG